MLATTVPADEAVLILWLYRPKQSTAVLLYRTYENCAGLCSCANFVLAQAKD